MAATSGSAQHNTVTWTGGGVGTVWRLERRQGDTGNYTPVAEVDSAAGVWLDTGLAADTAYAYRLSRTDGTVLATATARTGTAAVLTTAAPEPRGNAIPLPFEPTTTRIRLPDGSLQLDLPAGSLTQTGTATLQPTTNPLADGVGPGMALSLPERPARTLTLSLRYGAEERVDDMLQDRIALRQADGSWWLLPIAAHDEAQRTLQVSLPPSLWVASSSRPSASALHARPGTLVTAGGVKGEFVRVKAHKLVPASATVRTLGSQRFVPVSIYVVAVSNPIGGDDPDDELVVPLPVLRDVQVPILNNRAGFQRQWTLEGSTTPDAALGTLVPQAQAGVDYTAPAQVPATNPVTLRFQSTNTRNGRRLTLSAKLRIAEDAWVGRLNAFVGGDGVGDYYTADTRWMLDAAQSTATQRVYRPTGSISIRVESPCAQTLSPATVTLEQSRATGQLVVDESINPARYALELNTIWNATRTFHCSNTSIAGTVGRIWNAQGQLTGAQIRGADSDIVERNWLLERPQ